MRKDVQLLARLAMMEAVWPGTGFTLVVSQRNCRLPVVLMRRFLAVVTYNVSGSVKVLGLVEPDECHLHTLGHWLMQEVETTKLIVEPQLSLNVSPHR